MEGVALLVSLLASMGVPASGAIAWDIGVEQAVRKAIVTKRVVCIGMFPWWFFIGSAKPAHA
jgi:hypothetical protein